MNAATPPQPAAASGEFDVRIGEAESLGTPAGAPPLGRRSLDKTFRGDLQGRSLGVMLAGGAPQTGEAAYSAIESFAGTLHGRTGGFALAHLGVMHAGTQDLRIVVVPGSGTGELAGITGELRIRIEGGRHSYVLDYALG